MTEVLIVDDNEDIAESLEDLLVFEGYDVRAAHDGEEGLAALHARRPDVVFLDVEMPGLDGPGLAGRMRVEDLGLEKIPLVLCSACTRLPEVAAQIGTPYYIAKPPDPGKLMALLSRAARERIPPHPSAGVAR